MRKLFFLSCTLCFAYIPLFGQYATSGSGAIKDYIWWFNWAGFSAANGNSKFFITPDGLRVTIAFTNVSGNAVPDVMNTWRGAVLHNLYDFTDPAIMPSLHSKATNATAAFTMTITATRNGLPAPFTFVAGDAEASDDTEITRLITSGSAWNRIENYNNTGMSINPLTGCNTTTVEISHTYGGASGVGQNPLIATNGIGAITVTTSMERKSGVMGGMAMAFGILAPIDRGDLPVSYGFPNHQLNFVSGNGCNYPAAPPPLVQTSLLHIGTIAGDPDGVESNNDGPDEDGITVFPDYNGSNGQYNVVTGVTNLTGNNAYLTGWMDFNRDGTFSAAETITKVIAPNATSESFTWTNLPYILPGQGNFAFRFRISSDRAVVQTPAGGAPDGEVEDYLVPIIQICLLSKVNAGADQNICAGRTANLQASGAIIYTWVADNDLSDPLVPDPVATTPISKSYFLTGEHANGCISKDTISVTVMPAAVFSVTPQSVTKCEGLPVSFTAKGGDKMDWLDSRNNYLGSGAAYNTVATTTTRFRVAFEDLRCNVRDTLNIPLTVFPAPQTYIAKSSDLDCATGRALLSVFGGERYQWAPGPGITDVTSRSQWVTPDSAMQFYVLVTDQWGCIALDSIYVNVNTESGMAHYQMANAFTPNGDGQNDCFGIKYPGLISKLDFTIYDRWGAVMFHTNQINDCWDGTFKGVPMDINTYVYVFRIESPCGRVERKGTVTLLR